MNFELRKVDVKVFTASGPRHTIVVRYLFLSFVTRKQKWPSTQFLSQLLMILLHLVNMIKYLGQNLFLS